ncbi:hypothetical protein L1887_37825 [Cichorium endivia]|nr:hypothetical protein L1887_37825 [Cichorium endivia]
MGLANQLQIGVCGGEAAATAVRQSGRAARFRADNVEPIKKNAEYVTYLNLNNPSSSPQLMETMELAFERRIDLGI